MTLLFKACGYSSEDILSYFYKTQTIWLRVSADRAEAAEAFPAEKDPDCSFFLEFGEMFQKGQRASEDITDPLTGETVVKKGAHIHPPRPCASSEPRV